MTHDTDKLGDYRVAFYSCTATRALDEFQGKWRKGGTGLPKAARLQASEDKRRAAAGFHPDRDRSWFTFTEAEGLPN